jgi:hypothetical protein
MKKMIALMAGLLILGMAVAAAQEKTQAQAQEKGQVKTGLQAQGETEQNQVQAKSEFRLRNKTAFVDENGDGINDLAKDADGDGIPNCQDPDWTRPLDGSGYMAQHMNGQAAGSINKAGFGKGSFRNGTTGAGKMAGAGVCDGTGPKGSAQRKGRR